jgi:hypothetical protein
VFRFPFSYFDFWFHAQRFSPLGFRFDISVPRFPISLSAAVSGHRSFGISFSVLVNRRTDEDISGEQARSLSGFPHKFSSLGCCSLHTVCAPPSQVLASFDAVLFCGCLNL